MKEFDFQWSDGIEPQMYECNEQRVKEFLELTKIKPWYSRTSFVLGKNCLDAGCGPGRWTCAMLRLGASNVDSFDINEKAVEMCKRINPKAYVFDLMELKHNPVYDFVLCWGVIHHMADPRRAFSKLATQVKKNGMLHVMVYDKKNDWFYDGFRGSDTSEARRLWASLSHEERIKMCKEKAEEKGGTIHGWWDALNPEYNYSFEPKEIKKWFEEEGFSNIRHIKADNINVNAILE